MGDVGLEFCGSVRTRNFASEAASIEEIPKQVLWYRCADALRIETRFMKLRLMWARFAACSLLISGVVGIAQGPKPRLASAIGSNVRVALPGTRPELATVGEDQGAAAADMPLKGITLVFRRSTAQQADLDALLAAQGNPASPVFHQWLTADAFAARFGVADADIAKVRTWLQAQGFAVDGVARSRDRIVFDGTAGQVAAAFGTQLHHYGYANRRYLAPASDLTVPADLSSLVAGVSRLSTFHPHRLSKLRSAAAQPAYTSSQTGNHFLTPSDVATMYDLKSTYGAGYNGRGQSIAVIGQSYISTVPIVAFQSGANLQANLPTMILVPNTGQDGVDVLEDGDEGESQLDVEYAGGMAPGANVYFIYTGDDGNADVFDSLEYAIAENVAPVITLSYGQCETLVNQAEMNIVRAEVQQANAQGQTVLSSSGDDGSTDCSGNGGASAAQQVAVVADFPGTVPEVTSMGGLQMAAGTFTASLLNTQYWQGATGSDTISSLLSYVPEVVWNEDTSTGISSGGGGASTLYTRPAWQAGVPGIPAGTQRLVPDIALQASINSPGYIYCTSDPSDLSLEGITTDCVTGLRSSSSTFQVAGGTSFAAPIFAGMLAVLNQVTHSTGQGNLNQTLYGLAGNSTTYASAFHDVTSGTNGCIAGSSVCSTAGASQYAATVGYDEASGLGSVDFAKLAAAWPVASTATLAGSVTTVQPANATATAGSAQQVAVKVQSQSGSGAAPTGTVTVTVNVNGNVAKTVLTLVNGAATYNYTAPGGVGSYVITAVYSGDGSYSASTGAGVVTLGTTVPSGSFTLSASNLSVAYNGTVSGIFRVTPASGYTGTVVFNLTYPSGSPGLCYSINPNSASSNVALANYTTASPTLLIGEGTACTGSASGNVHQGPLTGWFQNGTGRTSRRSGWPEGVAMAGLLCVGFGMRRSRRLASVLGIVLLAFTAAGLLGCGGSNGATTTPVSNQPQNVTLTLTGTDSVTPSITASTTFTLTVNP